MARQVKRLSTLRCGLHDQRYYAICRSAIWRASIASVALSPVEVMDACLARIEKPESTLNAFVTLTEETARMAAPERRAGAGGPATNCPLLFGIPFSVKDTLPTGGVRTTFGSRLFADFVPDEDAAAVAAVKRAGGIMLGKTNSPTLGWIGVTHNKIFGATPNPWNLSVAAGGSSGGAAVAAAARMTPVNIGTDGGGSLRIPASFTGTVGFKPSYGRVPNYPTGPNWGLQHIGPISRTVEDAAIALDALVSARRSRSLFLPPVDRPFADAARFTAPHAPRAVCTGSRLCRIGRPRSHGDLPRRRAGVFSSLDTRSPKAIPAGRRRWNLADPVRGRRRRPARSVRGRTHSDDIEEKLLEFIAEGQRMAPDAYYRAWLAKNDWWQEIRRTFEQYDLVVTPTVACPPFALGHDTGGTVAGKPVSFYGWAPFSAPFNLTGQPAISIPAGFTAGGLPVGLQLIGHRFADALVLAVAAAFERIRPWVRSQVAPIVAAAGVPGLRPRHQRSFWCWTSSCAVEGSSTP